MIGLWFGDLIEKLDEFCFAFLCIWIFPVKTDFKEKHYADTKSTDAYRYPPIHKTKHNTGHIAANKKAGLVDPAFLPYMRAKL